MFSEIKAHVQGTYSKREERLVEFFANHNLVSKKHSTVKGIIV